MCRIFLFLYVQFAYLLTTQGLIHKKAKKAT